LNSTIFLIALDSLNEIRFGGGHQAEERSFFLRSMGRKIKI